MLARGLCGALMLLMLAPSGGLPDSLPIVVVVHPDRRAALSVDDLAQIYLRRKRFWDDGAPIVPLNLPGGTALRVEFSRSVLHENEDRLADYWNRQYLSGVLPPATLASTEAVLRYVASDPNAIGYVPASEVNDSVGVLLHLK